ncbi:MAG: hypothetical protein QOH29_787 [Actinomycetota bacterium]|jgi:hypothetical protein|nr:hypothetical protein [Actinomycetota bacterium]
MVNATDGHLGCRRAAILDPARQVRRLTTRRIVPRSAERGCAAYTMIARTRITASVRSRGPVTTT